MARLKKLKMPGIVLGAQGGKRLLARASKRAPCSGPLSTKIKHFELAS